jgi:hypothetical protein
MYKAEIASYLVSLHTLLEAQSKGSHSIPSAVLAAEYDRYWGLLKQEIENDETRNSKQSAGRSETGADQQGSRRV